MKKIRVLVFPKFLKLVLRPWVSGVALFPFIFIRHSDLKQDAQLINHENIHIRQQLEILIIPFYIWYAVEFIIKWAIYRSSFTAYKNISFEREAYQNDKNLNYLQTKSLWTHFKYL